MYYIRKKVDELALDILYLKKDITVIKVEQGKQIIRSGVVGLIGGVLPVVVTIGIAILILILKG